MSRMTPVDYRFARDSYAGFCTECKKITNEEGVEPDAENYECEECGSPAVIGVENALIQGLIDASSDDDDGDENAAIEEILPAFSCADDTAENEIRTRSLEEANEWDNYESHISGECDAEW